MQLSNPFKPARSITNSFGPRPSFQLPDGRWTLPYHYGSDFSAPGGTPIYAVLPGTVIHSGWDYSGYGGGWQVAVKYGDYTVFYLHMQKQSHLRKGNNVKRGQLIGYVGTTGASTGNHLHLEVHYKGTPVNPAPLMSSKKPSPSKPATGKGTKVKHHYRRRDKTANGKNKRTMKPGTGLYLNQVNARVSNATNIVGGIGYYSITAHVYVTGTPGDTVDLVLVWQDTKKNPRKNSRHFVETIEIGADGTAKRNVEFKRHVSRGFAVYARLETPKNNKGSVQVNLLDTDAYLFG